MIIKNIFSNNIINIICFIICFSISSFFYFNFIQSVFAQTSATQIVAEVIGGKTAGITDICCNGIVLEFDSVDPGNPFILDGEALWVPGFTQNSDYNNEFMSEYNTVGKLFTGQCITVESFCETPENMPFIWTIGTGGIPAIF